MRPYQVKTGILTRAADSKQKTEIADIKEEIQRKILEEQVANQGDLTETALETILTSKGTLSDETDILDRTLTTADGKYSIPVRNIWDGTLSGTSSGGTGGGTGEGGTGGGDTGYVSVTEIFQNKKETDEGYDATKLHIGDFVNYDAGTWTADEISQIQTGATSSPVTANGDATTKPSTAYQFGGFGVGTSRNGNAVPYDSSYNYVQETTAEGTKQAVTGWRVFDVDESTGAVTLISAGCPEDYNHPSATNSAYISEYILTGNVNSNWSGMTEETAASTYTKRNWNKYVNAAQKATGATAITKGALDNWYSKYMGYTNADTYTDATFQSVYGTKYESMVDNYSYYWLSSADDSGRVYFVNTGGRHVNRDNSIAYGVRLLVSLSSEVKLSEERVGTKTVTSRSTDYTYNVWDLN